MTVLVSRAARAAALATASLIALNASGAAAQTAAADGRVIYAAAWFTQYGPSTAWDMAARAPGFSVDDGEEVRGFAGAAGNVVINGARPSAKSETLEAILRRIPASQVVRLELVPGSVLGGEYRSRALVLNVVMNQQGSLSTSSEATFRRAEPGDIGAGAKMSVLRRKGDHSVNLSADLEYLPTPDGGYDALYLLPGDVLVERRDKQNIYRSQSGSLGVNWTWGFRPGASLQVNGLVYDRRNPLTHTSHVTRGPLFLRDDTIDQTPIATGGELGADVSWPLAGGTFKLIGLVRREHNTMDEIYGSHDAAGDLTGGIEQNADNYEGETLARAVWSTDSLAGMSFETGAEIAQNFLDAAVDLYAFGPDGVRVPVTLPIANGLVKELRGEAFVALGRRLSPTVMTDGGLAVEVSSLRVTGDAQAERDLIYLKPRAAVEWRPDARLRVRAALERKVAQLDFDDFVSAVVISDGRVNAGNPDLQPERTWRASLTLERQLLGDGKASITAYADKVSMVQDRVPTGVGLDGPGNLGDGERLGAEVVLDAPVNIGPLRRGRLGLRAVYQDSSVIDPYTHQARPFSSELQWTVNADFRQDLTSVPVAWGLSYYAQGPLPEYRMGEVDTWYNDPWDIGAFVEYRPRGDWVLRADVQNILDREVRRKRNFHAPDRSNPVSSGYEDRIRHTGTVLLFTVKHTTG